MVTLDLSTRPEIQSEFLKLFNHVLSIQKEGKNPTIEVFALKSYNNEFVYDDLEEAIAEHLIPYALSRQEQSRYDKYRSKGYRIAKKRLVEKQRNEGEFGEIMLFSFLECHLGAPKIATKLELKTNSEHYTKGSDGVHLLKLNEHHFQIIFGESKTISGTVNSIITKAINSIHQFKNRKRNNIRDEVRLVQVHIGREFSQEQVDFICQLLIPSETPRETQVEHAFGIFVGFPIEISRELKLKSKKEFEDAIEIIIHEELKNLSPHLDKKLAEKGLENHKLYVYILPIEDIEKKRKELIPDD